MTNRICLSDSQENVNTIQTQISADPQFEYYIRITASPCDPNLGGSCSTNSIISKTLDFGSISLLYPEYNLDLDSFETPLNPVLRNFATKINTKYLRSSTLTLTESTIWTDKGFFSKDESPTTYYTPTQVVETLDTFPQNNAFFDLEIKLSPTKSTVHRSYPRVLTKLAEIAIAYYLVYKLFSWMLSPYVKLKYEEYVLSELS